VDLWKLGWATTQLQPLDIVKKKVELLRSKNISVCNGGTLLELSEHQGKAEELFSELVEMGCDATEISSGSLDIDSDRVVELINSAKEKNLRVFCEVGKKMPEKDFGAKEYNRLMRKYLEAGAEKVILEARESGVSVGIMDDDGNPREIRMIEFYLILVAAGIALSTSVFWRLLIGTLIMLLGGYAGEVGWLSPGFGFVIGMAGWILIIFEIFKGESSLQAKSNENIKKAFNSLRLIVLIGWSIYPLGYIFCFITPMIGGSKLLIRIIFYL
jgi:hypothetical protein